MIGSTNAAHYCKNGGHGTTKFCTEMSDEQNMPIRTSQWLVATLRGRLFPPCKELSRRIRSYSLVTSIVVVLLLTFVVIPVLRLL